MGKNEIEPKGAGGVWPIAEQARVGTPLHPLQDQQDYALASSGSDINLAMLWNVVWAWRWLILGAIAAGLAGGVIVTLLMTPTYRATTVIELNPPVVEVMENQQQVQRAQNDRQYLETQYGLLRSRALAERVSQELNLASNPALV